MSAPRNLSEIHLTKSRAPGQRRWGGDGLLICFALLNTVAQYDICEMLVDGPLSADELAQRTGTKPDKLERVLKALVKFGIFEVERGKFSNNEEAEFYLRNPTNKSMLRFYTLEPVWNAWQHLPDSLRSDHNAFEEAHGKRMFEYFHSEPRLKEEFFSMLAGQNRLQVDAILGSYDFSGMGQIVDVGCGAGALLAAILKKHPDVTGTFFDANPSAIEQAQAISNQLNVTDRCAFTQGDFFKEIPQGDALLLKLVVHDWPDAQIQNLLHNCRLVLPKGGKVLLCEHLLTEGDQMDVATYLDTVMLAMQAGRERTESEYRRFLEMAEFSVSRTISTPATMSVIEAVAC